MALTEVTIRNVKPAEKDRKIFDGGGLYLLVKKNGAKLWRQKYRFAGVERLLALGIYPDVALKQAREWRDDARKLIASGQDPGTEKKLKKAALTDTFQPIALEWMEMQATPAKDSRKAALAEVTVGKALWSLNKYVFPEIGSRPIGLITAPELLRMLKKIEKLGLHETAHRARARCGQIWRYAVATGRAARDITVDLRGALAPVVSENYAAITDPKQIGALLLAIDAYHGTPGTTIALKLSPYVFVRPSELRRAEWNEFTLDKCEWRIPAARMKMSNPHIVPLSKQALALLKELNLITGRGRYLFPSLRSAERPMSDNTINAALRRLGYSTDEMTGHGFRSLASTCLNEQGWNPDWIEIQLAHGERNKVRAAYNHARYLPQRREMMQAWADYLDDLQLQKNQTSKNGIKDVLQKQVAWQN
jgi:integrase